MEKLDVVKYILQNTDHGNFVNSGGGTGWAPSNVALCKYWGKRDTELYLPFTSSLSISLGNRGSFTQIKQEGISDVYNLNGSIIDSNSKFALRLNKFLNLFRPNKDAHYCVNIDTNVPIAAGFASSACGFAAVVLALNNLYNWRLHKKELSILARMGSGSACRSIDEGFVEWKGGESCDGMDSYAVKLDEVWPELRIGALAVSTQEKAISSSKGMQITVETSPLYQDWIGKTTRDLHNIKLALANKDFMTFGQIAEDNAEGMHALMLSSVPSINYSLPETLELKAKVRQMRKDGIPVFFTQDAGPNLQLLFLAEHEPVIASVFPEIEIIAPFGQIGAEKIILVNEQDVEIGTNEKLSTHIQGKLHRAFSIFVLRKNIDKLEVLLQQRSSNKYHSANLWTNTCCGHPRPGENTLDAAQRRLEEEMGFVVDLQETGVFQYKAKIVGCDLIEHEIDHVFIGFYDDNNFLVNPDEVQDCDWVDIEFLKQDLSQNPGEYTAWLTPALQVLLNYKLKI